jgi:hypothetical protein
LIKKPPVGGFFNIKIIENLRKTLC